MMDGVGASVRQHRAPRLYQPSRELLGWLIMLAAIFGLALHVAADAMRDGDTGWGIVLACTSLMVFTAYCWVGVAWVFEGVHDD